MATVKVAEPFQSLFDENHPDYGKTYKVWYGGRGSGKTVSVAKGLLVAGMQRTEKILCTREFQNSIGDSVLSTLEDEITKLELHGFYTVQNNAIYGKNGTEFIFRGLRTNIQSLKSIPNVTKTWIEEGQTVSEKSLDVLFPTVLRTDNSQVIITFNPENDDDAVYKKFILNPPPNAAVTKVNFDKNPWFPPLLRDEMEFAKNTDVDLYNHVWLGECRKNGVGSIYGKWMIDMEQDGRICKVPHTPGVPTIVSWDLGFGDSTVLWFLQLVGKEPRLIDYYASNMESLDHYVQIINSKPYNYEAQVLPHDAGHNSLRTGTTLAKQLEAMGVRNVHVLPVDAVESGIQLVRQLMPQLWIDETNCKDGIYALKRYQYEFNEDRKVFSNRPLHNFASDPADSLRYMATYLAKRKSPIVKPNVSVYAYQHNQSWMG